MLVPPRWRRLQDLNQNGSRLLQDWRRLQDLNQNVMEPHLWPGRPSGRASDAAGVFSSPLSMTVAIARQCPMTTAPMTGSNTAGRHLSNSIGAWPLLPVPFFVSWGAPDLIAFWQLHRLHNFGLLERAHSVGAWQSTEVVLKRECHNCCSHEVVPGLMHLMMSARDCVQFGAIWVLQRCSGFCFGICDPPISADQR